MLLFYVILAYIGQLPDCQIGVNYVVNPYHRLSESEVELTHVGGMCM